MDVLFLMERHGRCRPAVVTLLGPEVQAMQVSPQTIQMLGSPLPGPPLKIDLGSRVANENVQSPNGRCRIQTGRTSTSISAGQPTVEGQSI